MIRTRAKSIVLVNTGHGKGKSSAAFGVMARGWARGWNVAVVQFVKGGKWKTGERKLADHLGIEWHTLGDGFTWESTDLERTAEACRSSEAEWVATCYESFGRDAVWLHRNRPTRSSEPRSGRLGPVTRRP